MASHVRVATDQYKIVTTEGLRPGTAVQPIVIALRYHQKVAALCFAAVGIIATVGWFYLIAMAFRAVVQWL
jgi:hypothetical protein